MDPQLDNLFRFLKESGLGQKESFEDIGQMADVELVVEVDGCLPEGTHNQSVQLQSGLDDQGTLFLH